MKAIYLIGFMGAGKTAVSHMLSSTLSVGRYDTDEEIIMTAGKSINAIFADEGEDEFRRLETKTIKKMPSEDAVIATGGGAILNEENRNVMKEKGTVVFLFADPAEILERLKGDSTRPLLLQNKEEAVTELYCERLSLYRDAANFEVDTTGKTVSEIVNEIIGRMKT